MCYAAACVCVFKRLLSFVEKNSDDDDDEDNNDDDDEDEDDADANDDDDNSVYGDDELGHEPCRLFSVKTFIRAAVIVNTPGGIP